MWWFAAGRVGWIRGFRKGLGVRGRKRVACSNRGSCGFAGLWVGCERLSEGKGRGVGGDGAIAIAVAVAVQRRRNDRGIIHQGVSVG